MLRAAIDTSSANAAFAVITDTTLPPIVRISGIPLGRKSGALIQHILNALKPHAIPIESIDQWSIGMGPGSFTCIRVGAALVKGICAGSNAAYRGVPSSLAMVMAAAPSTATTAIALHDGRRSEVLVSPYKKIENSWHPDGNPFPLKIAELQNHSADCVAILGNDRSLEEVKAVRNDLTILDDFPIEDLILAKPGFTPADRQEQEASCSPIYVRPAVFVEPTLKKHT